MVLGAMSPLFILLTVRGIAFIPDCVLIGLCGLLVAGPLVLIWLRVRYVKGQGITQEHMVGELEDQRGHLLTYLLATLLPFYRQEIILTRDAVSMGLALGIIGLLFWRLNLYYANILLLLFRYHIFTVQPPASDNPFSGRDTWILITRRKRPLPGKHITVYPISDAVCLAKED